MMQKSVAKYILSKLYLKYSNYTYPNLSMDIGGDEGGVCMDPAMVREELAQWGLWWSPFNLSGGVNMPPPPSVKLNKKHLYIYI